MEFEEFPEGWTVWNEEPRKVILTYRPDVFNSDAYPAPCLPTIHIRQGKPSRKPGWNTPAPDAPWYVQLYLEPDVTADEQRYEGREAAATGARRLAERFVAGDIEYRELYQVPRPEYLDKLDELIG
ncbi:hypothetical protein GRX03_04080 [Halovenus sp. WSH3]|uniref:Uncharacterized protein n=1 Tax=Halovenus carboxidivorans TaxID=2692199 RepID=A0A6B0SYV4_9EURY|nr:DUF5820 family protein [Halovenus carboxidivorans]MXR50784.1 hypothetical protein [Halovenus carboxidivorans]